MTRARQLLGACSQSARPPPAARAKPREDFRVDSLVFGEPVLALALEPELEDLIGPHVRIMPVNEAPGRALKAGLR
jgi:hypothetical protein